MKKKEKRESMQLKFVKAAKYDKLQVRHLKLQPKYQNLLQ